MDISTEELLEKLQKFKQETGESPTYRAFADFESRQARNTIKYRFDSWNKALEAAGLDTTQEKHDISKSDILRLYLGKAMTQAEVANELGCSPGCVYDRLEPLPDIKHSGVRKVLYFGRIDKSAIESIGKEPKGRWGIVEEENEYVFDPIFARSQRIRELAENNILPVTQ